MDTDLYTVLVYNADKLPGERSQDLGAINLASFEDLTGKGKRKKKIQGGNPSKRHRDRLNTELDNLAKLLPFPEETISKLDKISILRLTVSYLKAKSYFQVCATKRKSCKHVVNQNDLSTQFESNGLMSQLLLEALDGFIMIITTDGQLFYVSESVKDFLGYSQAALIHQSLYKFLHIDDHKTVRENLVWVQDCDTTTANEEDQDDKKSSSDDVFNSPQRQKSFACRIKCTMSHGGGFYKMFQCRGRMREIHIKKRDVDSVEYGLFAVISPVNTLPTSSTMDIVRKETMLASPRRFHLSDQNLNVTETFPLSSQYKTFLDPRHLHVPPITPNEPPTPTNQETAFRPSFFSPSFTFGPGSYSRLGLRRRNSSSSGINDESSTTDENASSEGSVDSSAPRRRVSFRLDEEKPIEKQEKIGKHRRMSAPTFPNQSVTSPMYESPYNGILHPGTPNWVYPSPFSNPLLGYQELLHRMDSRSFMSTGYLSPIYPPFSPGAVYSPYNPFLKRASSFPNIASTGNQPMTYPGLPGDNIGLLSPRVPSYDAFTYFLSNPRRSGNSSEASPSGESLSKREIKHERMEEQVERMEEQVERMEGETASEDKEKCDKGEKTKIEVNVTDETELKLDIPKIKIEHCGNESVDLDSSAPNSNESSSCSQRSPISEPDISSEEKSEKNQGDIQETLADIAQNFTSKLDSIKSSFRLSLDRKVASCLGKK